MTTDYSLTKKKLSPKRFDENNSFQNTTFNLVRVFVAFVKPWILSKNFYVFAFVLVLGRNSFICL